MRILLADLAKARKQLIESHALDDDPFFSRLWHHLFWLCSFLKSAVTIKSKGIGFVVRRRCYRVADRLFGGRREEQYCERLSRNAEKHRQKVPELKNQLHENSHHPFNLQPLY